MCKVTKLFDFSRKWKNSSALKLLNWSGGSVVRFWPGCSCVYLGLLHLVLLHLVVCLCVLELPFHSRPTLAGQRVVADDGDAEALPVLLDERNLVDLVSLQVGLNPEHVWAAEKTDQFILSQSLSQFMLCYVSPIEQNQNLCTSGPFVLWVFIISHLIIKHNTQKDTTSTEIQKPSASHWTRT